MVPRDNKEILDLLVHLDHKATVVYLADVDYQDQRE